MSENNSAALQSGTRLNGGKYIIKEKIGEGGFGITYKAIHSGFKSVVCIKEYFLGGKCVRNLSNNTIQTQGIKEDFFEDNRQRFVNEAKTLINLRHPNIVEVLDVFDENNTSYIVMSYIEGRSLQSIVDANGKLSYRDAVNYIAQISSAIGYIHSKHILHRDIKPDNIMITADYRAILIDFGSARVFEENKTQIHTSILTHGFAPPEQYTPKSKKGSYTDIYALGATLYYILTSEVPIESAARMTEKMPAPIDLSPDIPVEINRAILKAMQLRPENRHQSIDEFMDDLLNIKPTKLINEEIGGGSSKKFLIPIIVGALLLIVGVIIFLISVNDSYEDDISAVEIVDYTGTDLYPMVKVVGGEYTMGNNNNNDVDTHEHSVYVDGFYIGQYEVSVDLWNKYMGMDIYKDGNGRMPVTNVSFEDIDEFINRLNDATGKKYSLPTEAQWEYAARAGSLYNEYASKSGESSIIYDKNKPMDVYYDQCINDFNIYNMSGNVEELCLDYYDENYYDYSSYNNPVNRSRSDRRVVRGGSYSDDNVAYTSVYFRYYSEKASNTVGFRLVIN
ncbi:MAG: SUMF1/EgtB/PvdO family nonheme iron enzyme [Bacteroidales bacterium]|nr:SUMF1/EgtB/PvdO family nonheme iron enzyme [Bacteroidales bacterium]